DRSHTYYLFFLSSPGSPPDLHSFPTRRSSDLLHLLCEVEPFERALPAGLAQPPRTIRVRQQREQRTTQRRRIGGRDEEASDAVRSEEHTSELQSLRHLVCRLLLEKKNTDTRLA